MENGAQEAAKSTFQICIAEPEETGKWTFWRGPLNQLLGTEFYRAYLY